MECALIVFGSPGKRSDLSAPNPHPCVGQYLHHACGAPELESLCYEEVLRSGRGWRVGQGPGEKLIFKA